MAASLPYHDLREVYPLIEDTLARIKKIVYQKSPPENRTTKFLLNKIEADVALNEKNYGRAAMLLQNAIQHLASDVNDTLRCLSLLKSAFIKMGNINRAFEVQYLMESRWLRRNDTVPIYFGAPKSSLYTMVGLHTEALRERRKEFENRTNKKDTNAIVSFYNDMGVFFNKKKLSDSAENYFIKAKALLMAMNIPKAKTDYYNFYKGLVDGNLAQSYFISGRVEKAIPLLKDDIYYSLKGKFYESAFNSYNLMAQCYIQKKNALLTKLYLDSAQSLLDKKLRAVNFRLKFMPTQASYYELMKDYKSATEIYKKYQDMNNSFLSLEKEKEMINQEVTFNIEQREIERIEREKLLKQIQLDEARQRFFKAYLIAGFLILCVIIVFLIVNNRGSKKREEQLSLKNRQINEQKAQIEHSLKEKEALIKEIHHRVKNNLQIITSMLNLQMSKANDEKTELILFEAKQRINAIALTHQMLYQKVTISNIRISEYINTLVKQIENTMASPLIELVVDVPDSDDRLTIDGAVPLGLIINELLTNAYKHAFPKGREGRITVSLTDHPGSFTVSVADNGIGFNQELMNSENKTLGMELVHILVDQLDSKLVISSDHGTMFKFDIKKTQLK